MDEWSKIYENFESYDYYNVFTPHEDISKVIKFFKKDDSKDILDLGCGAGRNLIPLLKEGFNVSGIDLSKTGILLIKKQIEKEKLKTDLKIGDIYKKLPYKDNSFDGIISVQVIQHNT